MEQIIKKIGVNSTVLLTSLSLVACGGGGGYYGDSTTPENPGTEGGNQSETDTSKVPNSLSVALQSADGKALSIVQDNSQIQVAVKVLNSDKGGVSGKDIRLSITDSDKIGVESTNSKVTSDENGVATFTLNIPALQTATGKVQLVAMVDGTTVSMPYTLNIKKTSTIVSDYNLTVPQGVVLNLPKGSAEFSVQVTDTKGGAKAGQTVDLVLPEEMRGKFSTTSGSSISTDVAGRAVFKIEANENLTAAEILKFVESSQTLTFKLIDENRAEKQTTTALTFKDVSKVVTVLDVNVPDVSIKAKAGTAEVRVFAKNSNGDTLANTKVKLAIEAIAASYGVTLDKAEAVTNAQGYAVFTLKSDATHPIALSQLGIKLTATTESSLNIKGNATVQVITADDTAEDKEAIQRLEIASPYKVNASNDSVQIKVKAINFNGVGATKGKITLTLNKEAESNGVRFDGANTRDVDENGFVTYVLKTNAKDDAIARLVAAGITATLTTDNGVNSAIEIAVKDEAVSDEAVQYLQIDPITKTYDWAKDQDIVVRVKAVGVKGSALKSEKIVLKPNAQFPILGLSIKGQAERQTDENGYVTYTLEYKANGTVAQQNAAKAGVTLVFASISDSSKTQAAKINFGGISTKADLDYLKVTNAGSQEIQLNSNTDIIIDTKVLGLDGKPLVGQEVSIKLDELLLSNGVSYDSQTKAVSKADGTVQFKLKVNAVNATQLEKLIAQGLTFVVSSSRIDGSKFEVTRTINLSAKTGGAVASRVDYLLIDPINERLDYTKDQMITVKVKAIANNGSPLANEKINIKTTLTNEKLGKLHLSLVTSSEQVTSADGYATFVYEYKAANTTEQQQLPTKGVTLKATSANGKEQSLNLNFKSPASSVVDLDNFTVDTVGKVVLNQANKAQTVVKVRAVDTAGKVLANQKIKIVVDAASNNGVSVDTSSKTTNANGMAEFNLAIDTNNETELQSLLNDGLTITVTGERKDGSNYTVVRKIAIGLAEPESKVSYLAVDPILAAFDYSKSQSITIKAKAFAADGSILAGEKVKITTLTSTLAQKLGLALTSAAEQVTDALGYATFVFSYQFKDTTEQKNLPTTGIDLAVSSNGQSQPIKLNFKVPAPVQKVLDYFTLTSSDYAVELDSSAKIITFTVDAKDIAGDSLAGQQVSVGLNEAALQNGVVLTSPTTVLTKADGKATFTVKVDPKTKSQIENLNANDLTVAVVGKRPDGTQYSAVQKVELSKPEEVLPELASLDISSANPTLSVLGGETRVKVVAKDINGKTIPNMPISVALSKLTSNRVSISDMPSTTNSKGEAEFTVTIADGAYDATLIKNSIVFAVVGTSPNTGDFFTQTSSIGVTAPANALNPRLSADVKLVSAGQTIQVLASVKDEMGIHTSSGRPMKLSLNAEAVAAGVKLSADGVVVGNTASPISLVIPEDINSATLSSIVITGTINDDRGNPINTNLTFTVEDIVNLNELRLISTKPSVDVNNNDRALVTVTLLDQSGIPLANEDVTLSANHAGSIVIGNPGSSSPANTSGTPLTLKTDSNGNAFYSVAIDSETVDKELLLLSGIELTAQHIHKNGAIKQQVYRLDVTNNVPSSPQEQNARYSLRLASKATMNVRNDQADVIVTLVDANGGGVEGQYVSLALKDFEKNGAIIIGPSGLTTDVNGQATFKIRVDESARRNYTENDFIDADLRLTATFKEEGYKATSQIFDIDIIAAAVTAPRASIVIGVNNTEVQSSSDGVYYMRNLSASVTDFDGRPLANQAVTLEVTPLTYQKGRVLWAYTGNVGSTDISHKWIAPGNAYYDLSISGAYWNGLGTMPKHDNGTPNDPSDDTDLAMVPNSVTTCFADPSGTAVGANNIPVKVVAFVDQSGTTKNTFMTDANGKFDFAMRYPKVYAQWLNVRIGASSTLASLPTQTFYNLGLPPASSDYSNDGTYGPNLISPYGTGTTCP